MRIELERHWPQSNTGLLCRVCPTATGKGGIWMLNDRSGQAVCPKCKRTTEGLLKQNAKGDWILVAA